MKKNKSMKKIFFIFIILLSFQYIEAQPVQCFTAIHCDPSEPENFPFLEKLVDSANAYNIKLTIEFTGPWVDSILPYNYRKNKIILWHSQGHEIAMHHHDICHPAQWDGYTNHSKAEILAAGWDTNNYKGNMEYLYDRIYSIAGTAQLKTIGNSDSVDLPLNCIFQTQGIITVDGYSNPVTYNYYGKNYCRIGYSFISGLTVENTIENLYPSMTAYNSLGVVLHVFNFKNDSWPIIKWFQFVNDQDLQSKTVAQILISFNCPTITGFTPEKENYEVSFFPNPTSDNLTIEAPLKSEIEILNIEGQIIKSTSAVENYTTIDISGFARGMYFVRVKTENGVEVKEFVKE